MREPIAAVLFDKDGTLFDFTASWSGWALALIDRLGCGRADRAARLAAAIGFDPAARRFLPDSPVVAGTPEEVMAQLLPELPEADPEGLLAQIDALAAAAPMVPAVPLPPLLDTLAGEGYPLGVATNDAEAAARAHLAAEGIAEVFAFIAGYDSGFGAKPEPGMLLAFARAVGLPPARILMVGDSRHDLLAARAAGMPAVGVLTGTAGVSDLAPLAEAVLPDIGHLPGWIAGRLG